MHKGGQAPPRGEERCVCQAAPAIGVPTRLARHAQPCSCSRSETRRKLWAAWHRVAVPSAEGEDSGRSDGEPAQEATEGGTGSPEKLNRVCTHHVCARRPFCILDKLREVRGLYVEGRDQYRIKARGDCQVAAWGEDRFPDLSTPLKPALPPTAGQALDRAMVQLATHPHALDGAADVDAVGLGAKSAEKVKEILEHGRSSRVVAAADDEHRRVRQHNVQRGGLLPFEKGLSEEWQRVPGAVSHAGDTGTSGSMRPPPGAKTLLPPLDR